MCNCLCSINCVVWDDDDDDDGGGERKEEGETRCRGAGS